MFKQELPLMFPDDPDVAKVRGAMYDPFEYLMLRHKYGKLNTDFKQALGKVSYHAACHQRVQNIGPKTGECWSWCRTPRSRSSSAARATTAPTP
jgi:glycerol-3-phosphate dehydrogenase subunit C